jgi:hypothetical protein
MRSRCAELFARSRGLSEAGGEILFDPVLLNYDLAMTLAPTGSVTGQTIGNFSGTGYSLADGDTLDISSLDSLNFSVTNVANTSPVPEPSTLVLLTSGLLGAGFLRRRFCM